MIAIPNIISQDFVCRLSAADLREIMETASENVVEQIMSFLPEPTEQEMREAHQYLDDGIYDSDGDLIGEKHPDD
jgi:hypothetical protein